MADGQLWRLATGHVVHLDSGACAAQRHRRWSCCGRCSRAFCGWRATAAGARLPRWRPSTLGFWFLEPRLQLVRRRLRRAAWLMAAGTVGLMRQRDPIALVAALLFVGKLAWEQSHGPLPFETQRPVIVSAHLYGAVGGLLAAGAVVAASAGYNARPYQGRRAWSSAFVFPGQGSQSVGMLGGICRRRPGVPTPSPRLPTSWATTCGSWSRRARWRNLNATERQQPAMLAAGVATWRLWRKSGGALAQRGLRAQPGRILPRWWPPGRCASPTRWRSCATAAN